MNDLIELIIYDTSFTPVGLVDNYTSLIWHKSYSSTGDFEIYIYADLSNANLLIKDYYVMREDDDRVGIIQDIKITEDIENGEYLTVTGKFAETILGKRIIWYQTQLSGTTENAMRSLVNDNAISPVDANRTISCIKLGALQRLTFPVDAQVSYENLEEYISELALAADYGYKMSFDSTDNKFIFSVFEGVDRSYEQQVNPHIVFSDENDNLLSSEYSEQYSIYKNTAKIMGEGEGTDRVSYVKNNTNTGMNRKELYVDARDISSNDGEINSTTYQNMLGERGVQKLAECAITKSFTGEVDFGVYKYKVDWDLGDKVTVENKRWGIYINPRITDIIESYSKNEGYKLVPTFAI